jgi:hypothetical protein
MRDLLVRAFLLMIKDEDVALGFAELQKLLVDGLPELFLLERSLGVRGGGGEVLDPLRVFVILGDGGGESLAFAAAALPLILRYIYDDAVEVGGELRKCSMPR